jgi:hypothetical protein
MPMDVLEQRVRRWTAAQQTNVAARATQRRAS